MMSSTEETFIKHEEEEELRFLCTLWDEALLSNEAARIEPFMADDWVIAGSGGITTKAAFLDSVQSGELVHTRMESGETTIKIYGDSAVVLSRGISTGTRKGQPFEKDEWYASTFIRTGETWRCVLTMVATVFANSK